MKTSVFKGLKWFLTQLFLVTFSHVSTGAETLPPLALSAHFSPAARATNGFLSHSITSEFQAGTTRLFVKTPDKSSATRLPVIYFLPVEAQDEKRWGDPQIEIAQLDLANRLGVICVVPTFSHLPWYCDHPTNQLMRQEAYFLHVVVPFVEQEYSAQRTAAGRLLLGFSKSGWGAWSLLLRHPDWFGCAVAWDAPLAMERGQYGMDTIVGTQENFEHYHIFSLLNKQGRGLNGEKRLALFGYDNFRNQIRQTHELMLTLDPSHEYRDGPQRRHHWNSGWVLEAATWLVDKK